MLQFNWFESINRWYNSDPQLWGIVAVKNAVIKGKITPEEFKKITGQEYTA